MVNKKDLIYLLNAIVPLFSPSFNGTNDTIVQMASDYWFSIHMPIFWEIRAHIEDYRGLQIPLNVENYEWWAS